MLHVPSSKFSNSRANKIQNIFKFILHKLKPKLKRYFLLYLLTIVHNFTLLNSLTSPPGLALVPGQVNVIVVSIYKNQYTLSFILNSLHTCLSSQLATIWKRREISKLMNTLLQLSDLFIFAILVDNFSL